MNSTSLLETPATTRREREKAQRRRDILSASERVFAMYGFEGASVGKIAQEAAYATGTIYLYFKDKLALYASLLADKLSVMVDQVEAAAAKAPSNDPAQGLRNAIVAQFEFHDQHQEFFEVLHRQQNGPPPAGTEDWTTIEAAMARHHTIIIELIERAQSRKLIREGSSRDFAFALLGMIIHLTHEAMADRKDPGEPLCNKASFVFALFMKGAACAQ